MRTRLPSRYTRKPPELPWAILSCGQGSPSVSSSVPVCPSGCIDWDSSLRLIIGLMSNIVDGIQRPLRVGLSFKMPPMAH